MRTLATIIGSMSLLLAACSTSYHTSVPYDDVYYSSKNQVVTNTQPAPPPASVPQPAATEPAASSGTGQYTEREYEAQTEYSGGEYIPQDYRDQPAYSNSETYTSPDGNTTVYNNYYYGDYDPYDDYDYWYSSRIRRFHHHYSPGYWDDYYTNRYWYTYDPWDYGLSIYLGSGWLWPSWSFYYNYWNPWWYGSGWGLSIGWGWGYPFYSPYYWSYSPYWSGYYAGYWNSYWGYPYDYYYNSFDDNSHYYGPRNPRSSHYGSGRTGRDLAFGDQYDKAVGLDRDPATGKVIRAAAASEQTKFTGGTVRQQGSTDRVNQFTPSDEIRNTGKVTTPASDDRRAVAPGSNDRKAVNPAQNDRNNPDAPGKTTRPQSSSATTAQPGKATSAPREKVAADPKGDDRSAGTQPRQVVPQQDRNPGKYYAPKNTTPVKPQQPPSGRVQEQPQQQRKVEPRTPGGTARKEYSAPVRERYSKPKDYYSPNFTKPKSSQEYVSPKTERMQAPSSRERNQANPGRQEQPNRTYSAPENNSRQEPVYRGNRESSQQPSAPSRSSDSRPSFSPGSSGSSSGGGSRSSSGSGSRSSGGSSSSGSSGRGKR